MRTRREQPFKSEADLCAAFIEWAKPQGWTAYAESCGFDILLAASDGAQIGVQAKLRFNMEVLGQAIEDRWAAWSKTGPDFRAVLVPSGIHQGICCALGLMPLCFRSWQRAERDRFEPRLDDRHAYQPWHYWNPEQRCELPAYVPDVAAGASGPVQLTKWKIGALKIGATNEVRGFVTRADFRHHGIDPRRWVDSKWMVPGERPGEFKVVANFAKQHPQVYPQVLADVREWLASSEGIALKPSEVPA